jgi:catechol 2,3-dioxygenase-like lactoylglutathione lyase family enzyme
MTVPSTDKGVTFYRDVLGFAVGVTTLNSGTTQEVLNGLINVPGHGDDAARRVAACRVTRRRPAAG